MVVNTCMCCWAAWQTATHRCGRRGQFKYPSTWLFTSHCVADQQKNRRNLPTESKAAVTSYIRCFLGRDWHFVFCHYLIRFVNVASPQRVSGTNTGNFSSLVRLKFSIHSLVNVHELVGNILPTLRDITYQGRTKRTCFAEQRVNIQVGTTSWWNLGPVYVSENVESLQTWCAHAALSNCQCFVLTRRTKK